MSEADSSPGPFSPRTSHCGRRIKTVTAQVWTAAKRLESLSATTRGTRGRSFLFVCFFVVAFFFFYQAVKSNLFIQQADKKH